MKRKFENYSIIFGFCFVFGISLFISVFYLSRHFYYVYESFSASIISENRLELVVDSKFLRKLNQNKTIYIAGKKYKVKIEKVVRNIIHRKSVFYHQVVLIINFLEPYSLLEVVPIMIYDKKKSLFTIFDVCLKGGENAKVK